MCSIEGCERPASAKGYCDMHYRRWRKGSFDLNYPGRIRAEYREAVCSFDGCKNPVRARGWCSTHYERYRLWGRPEGKPRGECEICGRRTLKNPWRCWRHMTDPAGYARTSLESVLMPGGFEGCWIRSYSTHPVNQGKVRRVLYEQWIGPVPQRLHKTCETNGCVNPHHTVPGSSVVKKKWPMERAVDALYTWYETHGRPPIKADWAEETDEHPSYKYVVKSLGGWKGLHEAAYIDWERPKKYRLKTHCKRGHLLTEGSYRLDSTGSRRCLACARIHSQKHYLKLVKSA